MDSTEDQEHTDNQIERVRQAAGQRRAVDVAVGHALEEGAHGRRAQRAGVLGGGLPARRGAGARGRWGAGRPGPRGEGSAGRPAPA